MSVDQVRVGDGTGHAPSIRERRTGAEGIPTSEAGQLIRSVYYLILIDLRRYFLSNALPWPGKCIPWLIVGAFACALAFGPILSVGIGFLVALAGMELGVYYIAGLLLIIVVVASLATVPSAVSGPVVDELSLPPNSRHYVGVDVHPWAHAIAHVALPRICRSLLLAGLGACSVWGASLVRQDAPPATAPQVLAAALVPVGLGVLGLALILLRVRRLAPPVGLSWKWPLLATTVSAIGTVVVAHLAAQAGLLGLPTDSVLLALLAVIGQSGAFAAPWLACSGVFALTLGACLAYRQVLPTVRPSGVGPYRIPGSGRTGVADNGPGGFAPSIGRQPSRARDLGSAGALTPSLTLMRILQLDNTQAAVLYRRIARTLPVCGGAVIGLGLAVRQSGTSGQLDWPSLVSTGTVAALVTLTGMTITSASGPQAWIRRFRWLSDDGSDVVRLCCSYLRQHLVACALPVLPLAVGLGVLQSDILQTLKALLLIPWLASATAVADLADPHRQEGLDGTAEGGLGGALITLAALAASTAVGELFVPLAASLALLMSIGSSWFAVRLLCHRIYPEYSVWPSLGPRKKEG